MISGSQADIVCLQEVGCSNANSAELQPNANAQLEPLIGRTGTLAAQLKGPAASLRGQVRDFFKSPFLEENPEKREFEHRKLSAILNCTIHQPNTLPLGKQLSKFYSSPRVENVKVIIVKKVKSPIFEDAASRARPEAAKKDDPMTKEKQLIKENQDLKHKVKWLQEVASSDKNVELRRRDISQHAKVTPKIVGYRYFLLVVVKSGVLKNGSQLDYVIPELPTYKQSRVPVTIQSIVNLNYHDDGAIVSDNPGSSGGGGDAAERRSGRVLVVDSITVNQSTDLESVALLEVMHFLCFSGVNTGFSWYLSSCAGQQGRFCGCS
jgi:hypothetical protein